MIKLEKVEEGKIINNKGKNWGKITGWYKTMFINGSLNTWYVIVTKKKNCDKSIMCLIKLVIYTILFP